MIPDLRIWAGWDEEDRENAIQAIKDADPEEPVCTIRNTDEIYINKKTGQLNVSFADDSPLSVMGELNIVANKVNKDLARDLAQVVGLDKEYKADDRGRITLGSQYSGSTVKVAVIGEKGDVTVEKVSEDKDDG